MLADTHRAEIVSMCESVLTLYRFPYRLPPLFPRILSFLLLLLLLWYSSMFGIGIQMVVLLKAGRRCARFTPGRIRHFFRRHV